MADIDNNDNNDRYVRHTSVPMKEFIQRQHHIFFNEATVEKPVDMAKYIVGAGLVYYYSIRKIDPDQTDAFATKWYQATSHEFIQWIVTAIALNEPNYSNQIDKVWRFLASSKCTEALKQLGHDSKSEMCKQFFAMRDDFVITYPIQAVELACLAETRLASLTLRDLFMSVFSKPVRIL